MEVREGYVREGWGEGGRQGGVGGGRQGGVGAPLPDVPLPPTSP